MYATRHGLLGFTRDGSESLAHDLPTELTPAPLTRPSIVSSMLRSLLVLLDRGPHISQGSLRASIPTLFLEKLGRKPTIVLLCLRWPSGPFRVSVQPSNYFVKFKLVGSCVGCWILTEI